VPTDAKVAATRTRIASAEPPAGKVSSGAKAFAFSGRLNDSWRAANLLVAKGVAVRRVDKASGSLHVGDYVVTSPPADLLTSIAKTTGVDFNALPDDATDVSHVIKPLRVAMYQRYNGGNADEGWTRLLFEQFDQPYKTIFDPELKSGNLGSKFDVVILPADNPATLTGGGGAGGGRGGAPAAGGRGGRDSTAAPIVDPNPRGGGGNAVLGGPGGGGGGRGGRGGAGGEGGRGGGGGRGPQMPAEYRSGFGDEGVNALREFVQAGGTLVTFGESGQLAIDRFELPLRDVTAGLPFKQFWCPGCTLHIDVDTADALGYGMPSNALAVWLAGSQAYDIQPSASNVQVIARLASRDVLQSGWLLGEGVIAGKPTMVSVPFGQGRIVLIGFRVQHRDQAHGTYKLLFNSLQR